MAESKYRFNASGRWRLKLALIAVLCAAFLICGAASSRRVVSVKSQAKMEEAVTSEEKKLVGELNRMRIKARASLLTLDYGLCGIAKKRAEAYITRPSAKDDIPGLGTLERMLKKEGIGVLAADEYVSRSAPASAVANWAASGGTSIVSEEFNAVGCAIAWDGEKHFIDVVFAKLEASMLPSAPSATPAPAREPSATQNVASAPLSTPAPSAAALAPNTSPAPTPSATAQAPNTPPTLAPTPTPTEAPSPTAAIPRVTDGTPTKIELEFLTLLNKERESKGLTPITLQKNTNIAAQTRAWEVADTGKYSADSPKYGGYEELLKEFSVTYRASGQALTHGINASPSGALKSLLKSSLYRPLLMSGDFSHAGIGVSLRGSDQIYVMYLTD